MRSRLNPLTKLENIVSSFCVILPTTQPKYKRRHGWKHNLCGGGNDCCIVKATSVRVRFGLDRTFGNLMFKCKLRTLIQTLVKKATVYTSNPSCVQVQDKSSIQKKKKLAHGILQPLKKLDAMIQYFSLILPSIFFSQQTEKPRICRNVLCVLATQAQSGCHLDWITNRSLQEIVYTKVGSSITIPQALSHFK